MNLYMTSSKGLEVCDYCKEPVVGQRLMLHEGTYIGIAVLHIGRGVICRNYNPVGRLLGIASNNAIRSCWNELKNG